MPAGAQLETVLAALAVGAVRTSLANSAWPFSINFTHWYECSEVDHSRLNTLNLLLHKKKFERGSSSNLKTVVLGCASYASHL